METRSFSAPSTSREALKGRHLDSGLECVGSGEGHTKPRQGHETGAWSTGCRLLARQGTPILSKEDRQRESVHLGPGEGKGLSWEGRGRSVGMRTA